MNSILDEKTTSEEDGEKEKKQKISKIKNENDIKSRLRKNPQRTQILYSIDELEKLTKPELSELQDTDIQIIKNILEKIKSNPKSLFFRQSAIRMFNTKKDKEYYKSIISHPQDLGNITKKLNHNKYNSYQEFYDDLNLIWDNAQLFNEDNAEVYKDADVMRKYTNKIFQENNLYDKVDHIEKIGNKENENNDTHTDNNDEYYEFLIGKKRKNYKEEENNNNSQDVDEEEKKPIIDIKNNNENKDDLKEKNSDNKKINKVSYITNPYYFKRAYNNKYLYNDNLENSLKDFNKIAESINNSINKCIDINQRKSNMTYNDYNYKDKNKDKEKYYNEKENKINNDSYDKLSISSNIKNYSSQINSTKEKNNISSEEYYQHYSYSNEYNMSKTPDEKNVNEYKYNQNNINQDIKEFGEKYSSEFGDSNSYSKKLSFQKREEEEKKMNTKNELTYIYTYKIAKELDKLTDEDMFNLIEFVDNICPQAVIEIDDTVNIDMTKFIEDTYVQVSNFIKHIKINKSLI